MNGFEFYTDVINIYREVDLKLNYKLNDLLKMINNKGAINAAKFIVKEDRDTYGLELLMKNGMEDLTIERLILNEKYKKLFNDEDRELSRIRLKKYKNVEIENKDSEEE
ncbi:hypothetical protein [Clostridium sp. Ade.TY]|uniref:hypothetical protein n=1 Tax=Clostridium sp. Ade.TY TaxID=1391647 RepID=UPI0004159214|nr:hypothetical protein [Clostridium sp. Ade.TY]